MTMTLKIGRRATLPVASYAEASNAYAAQRDASGEGFSTFPFGKLYKGKKQIGYVTYNGKVCEGLGNDWTTMANDKLLFPPVAP